MHIIILYTCGLAGVTEDGYISITVVDITAVRLCGRGVAGRRRLRCITIIIKYTQRGITNYYYYYFHC